MGAPKQMEDRLVAAFVDDDQASLERVSVMHADAMRKCFRRFERALRHARSIGRRLTSRLALFIAKETWVRTIQEDDNPIRPVTPRAGRYWEPHRRWPQNYLPLTIGPENQHKKQTYKFRLFCAHHVS